MLCGEDGEVVLEEEILWETRETVDATIAGAGFRRGGEAAGPEYGAEGVES